MNGNNKKHPGMQLKGNSGYCFCYFSLEDNFIILDGVPTVAELEA